MDTRTEGYLIAAMALIPTGVGILTSATDTTTRLIGLGVVTLGIIAVVLRGQQKDTIAGKSR